MTENKNKKLERIHHVHTSVNPYLAYGRHNKVRPKALFTPRKFRITPYNVGSVLWRLFSTLEVVQYIGGITSVLWRVASVLWRLFSTVGGSFSTVGDSFSTVGG